MKVSAVSVSYLVNNTRHIYSFSTADPTFRELIAQLKELSIPFKLAYA